jgi:hypothetical protein
MPDNKNKNVEEFVKTNPNYSSFFKEYPMPENIDSTSNVRKLEKVVASYNGNQYEDTPQGKVLREPGYTFKKVYHDGTTEPITENQYQTMKAFNKLPPNMKDKYIEPYDPNSLDAKNKEIALHHQKMVQMANEQNPRGDTTIKNNEQDELNKYGYTYPYIKELEITPINSKELYDKIAEEPTSFTNYYNALLRKNNGNPSDESKSFLKNINKYFAKDFGFAYDPNTTTGLHPIPVDNPKYSQIMKESDDNWNKSVLGINPKQTETRLLGGPMMGIK